MNDPRDRSLDFTAANGVRFRARIVLPCDGYGEYDQAGGFALRHGPEDLPVIEFYDARYGERYGQFVSRYFIESLQARDQFVGLDLSGGVPDWEVDAVSMAKVLTWAESRVAQIGEERLASMVGGYLKAALFATADSDGAFLEESFDATSMGEQVNARATADCTAFVTNHLGLVNQACHLHDYLPSQLGADFWLSRNRTGAGYEDRVELRAPAFGRESVTLGQALAEAAREADQVSMEIGADGKPAFWPEPTPPRAARPY